MLGSDPFKDGEVADLLARLNDGQMDQARAVLTALAYPEDVRQVADKRRSYRAS